MPEYLCKKSSKTLDKFWPKMKEAWFSEFPEELTLDLPVQDFHPDPNAAPVRKLTEEENKALGKALDAREKVSRQK